jgi:hypothetical protein
MSKLQWGIQSYKVVQKPITPWKAVAIVVFYTTLGSWRGAKISCDSQNSCLYWIFLYVFCKAWRLLEWQDTIMCKLLPEARSAGYWVFLSVTPCSMSDLTKKIQKVNLLGGGRSTDVYKATYATRAISRQVFERSDTPFPLIYRKTNRLLWSRTGWLLLTTQSSLNVRLVMSRGCYYGVHVNVFPRKYWCKPVPGQL